MAGTSIKAVGYTWATDNWVELHIFKSANMCNVYEETGVWCDCGYNTDVDSTFGRLTHL